MRLSFISSTLPRPSVQFLPYVVQASCSFPCFSWCICHSVTKRKIQKKAVVSPCFWMFFGAAGPGRPWRPGARGTDDHAFFPTTFHCLTGLNSTHVGLHPGLSLAFTLCASFPCPFQLADPWDQMSFSRCAASTLQPQSFPCPFSVRLSLGSDIFLSLSRSHILGIRHNSLTASLLNFSLSHFLVHSQFACP